MLGRKLVHVKKGCSGPSDLGSKELRELLSVESLIDDLALGEVAEWSVYADGRVYGFYCDDVFSVVSRNAWASIKPIFCENAEVKLHVPYASRWLAPHLAKIWRVRVFAGDNGKWFEPTKEKGEGSYDSSADLYDMAFTDMRVRKLEWEYVTKNLAAWAKANNRKPKLLEIGCGNGQLLRQLLENGYLREGKGLDASKRMVELARERHQNMNCLHFDQIKGSGIACEDESIDLVMSFMSFRYLDWEEIGKEVKRVLRRDGIFIMVDMAETVLSDGIRPLYEETKARDADIHRSHPEFSLALKNLVADRHWQEMLKFHPKEQAEAYQHFLCSRFIHGNWKRLYVCYDHSLFGFLWQK